MKNVYVVVYQRVSKFLQDNERQVNDIQEYCTKNDLTIIQSFEEKMSGVKKVRPALSAMLEYLKVTPNIDSVIISELSRISRSTDVLNLIEFLTSRKINLYCLKENLNTLNIDKTENSTSKLVLTIFAGINSNFIDTLKYQIKSALKTSVKNGHAGGGQSLPYGYMRENKILLINPTEAETVKMIFNMSLEMGTKSIAKYLNQKEIPTKRGGKWVDITCYRILSNTIYIGQRRFNDGTVNKKGKHDKYIHIDAPQLRIIDTVLFEKVQTKFKSKDNKQGINVRYPTLFNKGKMVCGVCNANYMVKRCIGKRVQPVYMCSSRRYPKTKCSNHSISVEKSEKVITNYLLSNFTKHIINQIDVQDFDISIKNLNQSLNDYKIILKKEINKKNRLIYLRISDEISPSKFTYINNQIDKEIIQLEQKISELKKEIEGLEVLKRNKTDLQQIGRNIRTNGIDRNMIRNIINKITIYPEEELKLCSFKGDMVYKLVLNINQIDFILFMSQRSEEVVIDEYTNVGIMELSLRETMKRHNVIPSNLVNKN